MRKAIWCLFVVLAACGNGAEQAQDPVDTPSPAETCEPRDLQAPPSEDGPGTSKPDIEVPEGAPPCDLVSHDIYEGTGDEAPEGATVTVQYVGVSWSTGEEFDSSWDRGQPATFPLSGVIEGWQQGIPGMKEGGRRQLVIPPELAYGPQPPPGSGIGPNETLVFVIDLLEIG